MSGKMLIGANVSVMEIMIEDGVRYKAGQGTQSALAFFINI